MARETSANIRRSYDLQEEQGTGKNWSPPQCRPTTSHHLVRLPLALLAIILSLCAAPTDAYAPLTERNCREGQPLSRFRECVCGQYALIIPDGDVAQYKNSSAQLHTRRHGGKSRQQYYACVSCTRCGDGIRVDRPCTQRTDTQCSASLCTNPDWEFDFGSRSCRPKSTSSPKMEASTAASPVFLLMQAPQLPPTPGGDFEENGDTFEVGPSVNTWVQENLSLIIVCMIAAILFVFIILVVIMVLMWRVNKHLKPKNSSRTPYSNQSISNSSMNEPTPI